MDGWWAEKRIYIPLPGEAARSELFSLNLRTVQQGASSVRETERQRDRAIKLVLTTHAASHNDQEVK